MKYALLLYVDERATPDEAAHGAFTEMLKTRGALLDGVELASFRAALTLREQEGKVLRTDGPFVETVEHLGGFYLVEARDLDEAIEFATACPEPTVEVRPVVEYPG